MNKYDLIILGGGPGGYVCAERASSNGLSVALIEEKNLGGVCLNEGCIPLKSLLNAAKLYEHATSSQVFGIISSNVEFDMDIVQKKKEKTIKTLVSGVEAKMEHAGVKVIRGRGVIQKLENDIFTISVDDTLYYSSRLVIATGSEVIMPNIENITESYKNKFVITSREALSFKDKIDNLVVIGGGVIGIELASYFNSIGTKVTVIELFESIGGKIDKDVSKELLKEYAKKGINFILSSSVKKIDGNQVVYEREGTEYRISTDKVLVSIGRKPNIKNIGIENIGVQIENNAIVTDNMLRTNIYNVYAIGDVNGKSMLAHTAYREAEVAVNSIIGKRDMIRYKTIPSVIYTNPEVASVGHTKESAEKSGVESYVVKTPMKYSGRYVAETDGEDGFCKLVVSKNDKRILGVHLIGNASSEIIFGAVLMIEMEMCIDELREVVFPHPSISEVIREAFFA